MCSWQCRAANSRIGATNVPPRTICVPGSVTSVAQNSTNIERCDNDGRAKLHADIAHPIHSAARELIQGAVIKAYTEEKDRSKLPGYVCTYDEYDYDGDDVPVSYGTMVSEMGKGVKPHGAHPAPKGTHFNTETPAAKTAAKGTEEFGAGLV